MFGQGSDEAIEWRVSLSGRVLLLVASGVMIWTGIGSLLVDDLLFGVGFLVAGILSVWALGFRPRLIAYEDSLLVINPVRTWSVALADIVAMEPGYSGLAIRTNSGEEFEAWAVQQTNLAMWFRHNGRSSRVIEEIWTRVERAKAGLTEDQG